MKTPSVKDLPSWMRELIKFYDINPATLNFSLSTPVQMEYHSGGMAPAMSHTGELSMTLNARFNPARLKSKVKRRRKK